MFSRRADTHLAMLVIPAAPPPGLNQQERMLVCPGPASKTVGEVRVGSMAESWLAEVPIPVDPNQTLLSNEEKTGF